MYRTSEELFTGAENLYCTREDLFFIGAPCARIILITRGHTVHTHWESFECTHAHAPPRTRTRSFFGHMQRQQNKPHCTGTQYEVCLRFRETELCTFQWKSYFVQCGAFCTKQNGALFPRKSVHA